MALSLDRQAFVDIHRPGRGAISAARCCRRPTGCGACRRKFEELPGYGPDVEKNRAEARADHAEARLRPRQTPEHQGVDPQHPVLRDPAVILIDQLKEIYIDGELEPIDTAQ